MTAAEIAATVASRMTVEDVNGRDITVQGADAAADARWYAARLGAIETTHRPSALFGSYIVTVWMD